jgi:hypothetical protein
MLTRAELEAERAASKARCDARRAAEPSYTPDPECMRAYLRSVETRRGDAA